MKHYELLCVLRGTLSEDEISPLMEKVSEIITSKEGKIVAQNDMGKRRIAYPIKHIRYGYFHLVHFDAEPSSVTAIQDKLRLIPELLRAIVRVYNPAVDAGKGAPAVGDVIDEIKRKDDMERTDRKDRPRKKHHERSTERTTEKVAAPVETKEKEKETKKSKEGAASSEEKPKEEVSKEESISMEDIDKKLDEILQSDLDKV